MSSTQLSSRSGSTGTGGESQPGSPADSAEDSPADSEAHGSAASIFSAYIGSEESRSEDTGSEDDLSSEFSETKVVAGFGEEGRSPRLPTTSKDKLSKGSAIHQLAAAARDGADDDEEVLASAGPSAALSMSNDEAVETASQMLMQRKAVSLELRSYSTHGRSPFDDAPTHNMPGAAAEAL